MSNLSVQFHMEKEESITAQVTAGALPLPLFGCLQVGRVTFFIPGRDSEVGPSARELASKISAALYDMAAEADRKAGERAKAQPPAGDPIPAEEVPAF